MPCLCVCVCAEVFVYTVRCDGQAKLAVKTSMDSVTAEFEVAQHLLGHRFIRCTLHAQLRLLSMYHVCVGHLACSGLESVVGAQEHAQSGLRWLSVHRIIHVCSDDAEWSIGLVPRPSRLNGASCTDGRVPNF